MQVISGCLLAAVWPFKLTKATIESAGCRKASTTMRLEVEVECHNTLAEPFPAKMRLYVNK